MYDPTPYTYHLVNKYPVIVYPSDVELTTSPREFGMKKRGNNKRNNKSRRK